MEVDTTRRERSIFDAACELDKADRAAYLDMACGSDRKLRERIDALLSAADQSASFLETPAFASDPTLLNLPDPESLLGTSVGRHRLIEVLAEGGMGVVYKAEQEFPARIVALKVLRWPLDDQESINRFHYEVECLGKLRHPGIAQIIEAGVHCGDLTEGTPRLPYFAMEFVPDARPLTTYLREAGLGPRERLELLIAVCDAVHCGHVNGVIHCDLKPANILVDGNGQVRIIDFGIARTLEHETEANPQATSATRAGTAQYMSPEQCTCGAAVDTRSDVYSLGAVFYEALCGAPPYELRGKSIDEAAETIRTAPPRRPSEVNRKLEADLEAILLKALNKQPEERYSSVSEFAADLLRSLRHEPVMARPGTAVHQLRLMAWRHPQGVAAIVTILLLTVAAAAITGGLTFRLQEQRVATRAQADRATAITDFTLDLVNSADPRRGNRATLAVIDILEHSYDEIEKRFADEPLTAASLHSLIGRVFQSLSRYADAEIHLSKAWQLHVETRTEQSSEAFWTLAHLATLDAEAGRMEQAMSRIDRAVDGSRQRGEQRAIVGQSIWRAIILRQAGKPVEALAALNDIEADADRLAEDRLLYLLWNTRGLTLIDMSELEDAAAALDQAMTIARREYGDLSHSAAGVQLNLANLHTAMHRFESALDLVREAQRAFRTIEGPQSPQATFAGITETGLLLALGRLDEADTVGKTTYETLKTTIGEEDPNTLRSLQNLAQVYREQNRLDEASEALGIVSAGYAALFGPDHIDTIRARLNEGQLLEAGFKDAEAVALYRALNADATRVLGTEHDLVLRVQVNLICSLANSGQGEEALREGESYLIQWPLMVGWQNPSLAELVSVMEQVYAELDRPEDAARVRATYEVGLASQSGK